MILMGFRSHLKNAFLAFQESIMKLNVDGSWSAFLSLIHSGINIYIPSRTKKGGSERSLYDAEVRKTLRRQRACHAKMKKVSGHLSANERELIIK